MARKGRFMLGTLALYGVLLLASGVGSVLAYDARLERQTLELTLMVAPVPVAEPARPREEEPERPRANDSAPDTAVIQRAAAIARLGTSTDIPDTVSTRPNPLKELPGAGRYAITGIDVDPTGGGRAVGPDAGNTGNGGERERPAPPIRVVETVDPTPPPTPAPAPTPKRHEIMRATSSVISGKVISKPVPPYPTIARATRTQGPVNVEILIDERGNVISARAVSGPTILRTAAEQAARQARFTPTVLGGQPVKVSGVITYNFVLN